MAVLGSAAEARSLIKPPKNKVLASTFLVSAPKKSTANHVNEFSAKITDL